jgi:type I restriction enzyme, S subunit
VSRTAPDRVWQRVPLRTVLLSMESGSRPKGGVRAIRDGVPSIGGEHLTSDGGFNFQALRYVPEDFYSAMRRGHVAPGDLLVVKDGATTGKVSLVREDFPFERAVVNEHVFVCRPSSSISSRYLHWYLFSNPGQRAILEHFRGSAQGGITQDFADRTLIPLPPISVQHSISAYLDGTFARMAIIRSHLASAKLALRRFRKSILAAAISGTLTAEWRDRTFSEGSSNVGVPPPTYVAESPIDDLPAGWASTRLDQIAVLITDGDHNPPKRVASGIPHLTARNIHDNTIDPSNCTFVSKEDAAKTFRRYTPKADDLIVTCVGTLGSTALVPPHLTFSADRNLAALRFRDRGLARYIQIFMQSPDTQLLLRDASGSSAQPHLYLNDLRGIQVPLPPEREQREIVTRVDNMIRSANSLDRRLDAIATRIQSYWTSVLESAFTALPGSSPAISKP